MKKNLCKKLCFLLTVIISLNFINYSVFAKTECDSQENSVSINLMDNYNSDNLSLEELDRVHSQELKEQGKNIISSNLFTFDVSDKKTKAVYYVNVSWKIGYDKDFGLVSYVRATGPILSRLKYMYVMFTWAVTPSGRLGAKSDLVTNSSPTYKLHSTIETGEKFASKTRLKCTTYGDVTSVNEITGGNFSYIDYVVIP